MATAATAPPTDPLDAWISALSRDVRHLVVERVVLDSGTRGGRRDGRYRVSAYGPQGVVRGGVCAVEVGTGTVALASARDSPSRGAHRAASASTARPSATESALAARVDALAAEVTTLVLEFAAQEARHSAEIERLPKQVQRRRKPTAKPSTPQAPSTTDPRWSPGAPRFAPLAPNPDRFDLGRIVAPRFAPFAPNPTPPTIPPRRTSAPLDAPPLADFLRGAAPSPASHGGGPWQVLDPLIRLLRAFGMIPGVAAPAVTIAQPAAFMRAGALRSDAPTLDRTPANETAWPPSATAALVPSADVTVAQDSCTAPATPPTPAEEAPAVRDDEAGVDAIEGAHAQETTMTACDAAASTSLADAVALAPPSPIPPPCIDRSPSNEFVRMPGFLVPRSLVRRLDRLMRSAEPSSSDRAMERVYAEALTLGLDALAAELEIVRPTNDLGLGVSRALPRAQRSPRRRLRPGARVRRPRGQRREPAAPCLRGPHGACATCSTTRPASVAGASRAARGCACRAEARDELAAIDALEAGVRERPEVPSPAAMYARALGLDADLRGDPMRARERLRQVLDEGSLRLICQPDGAWVARGALLAAPVFLARNGIRPDPGVTPSPAVYSYCCGGEICTLVHARAALPARLLRAPGSPTRYASCGWCDETRRIPKKRGISPTGSYPERLHAGRKKAFLTTRDRTLEGPARPAWSILATPERGKDCLSRAARRGVVPRSSPK